MRFGVQIRATTETGNLVELAKQLEAGGFESVWLPEHTHIPVSVGKDHPEGADWLAINGRLFDPLIGLAAIAVSTTRLRLGTGVYLAPQHHPITLAKQVATLDVISDGRVLLGVGAGWNEPELANHGVGAGRQWAALRETVLALRRIWTEEEPSFDGEMIRFDPIWQWPKPRQRPHPPVLVGGEGPHVLERVLEYGDGWIPNDHPEVVGRIAELNRLVAERGRERIPVTVYAVKQDPARVEELAEAGAARCVFNLRPGEPEEIRWSLARLSELMRPYR